MTSTYFILSVLGGYLVGWLWAKSFRGMPTWFEAFRFLAIGLILTMLLFF